MRGLAPRADRSNGWVTTLVQASILFGVVEGVYGAQSAPLFQQCSPPQHRSVLRAIHTLNSHKIRSACLGGYHPSIWCVGTGQKASCGVLGGDFCWWQSWLDMVVSVVVGRWSLMSDWTTVGIVKILYGSILFYSYVDPIHSWHLIRQLKKEDLDLCTLLFSWFLCPDFYGVHPTVGGMTRQRTHVDIKFNCLGHLNLELNLHSETYSNIDWDNQLSSHGYTILTWVS